MPYDVLLVAGNGAGCGKISRSERFFTREGGKMTHKCLDLLFARFVAPPFSSPSPSPSPLGGN